jgi:Short C-terminal domain
VSNATPQALPGPILSARVRRFLVYGLLVFGGVLLFLTSFAVWINRVALNTNEFVDTSSDLVQDDAIRRAIATRAVDELYANVDVQAAIEERLADISKDAKPAAGPVASNLREYAPLLLERALGQPRLQSVWRDTVRRSHLELVNVLEGKATTLPTDVSTEEGVVTLDFRPLALEAADRVGLRAKVAKGLAPGAAQVEVLRSNELDAAQAGFELLKVLAWFLPVVMLLVFGLALTLARGRRRQTLRAIGLVIAVAAIVGLVAVKLVGDYVVGSLATDPDARTAGHHAWHILTALLRSSLYWQIVVGVLLVGAAWLAGPRAYALATRRTLSPLLRERAYPYVALAVVALVLLVSAPVQDFARLFFVAAIVGFLAVGIELLRTQTLREFPEGAAMPSLDETRARVTKWVAAQRGSLPAPRPREPTRATAGTDLTSRLQALAELHTSGALTDEEYATAKARVLAGE